MMTDFEPLIDPLSRSVTQIQLLSNGGEIGVASGFFFELLDEVFLITNWHVLSGRDPNTGQPRHHSLATPDEIVIFLHQEKHGVWEKYRFQLNGMDDRSLWFQHPFGQDVDIAFVKMPPRANSIHYVTVNGDFNDDDLAVVAGSEVFILGYPRGLAKQVPLPIWKRGSVASEPGLGNGIERSILVDTATREGMSGAPAIARSSCFYLSRETRGIKNCGIIYRFIGVYSGRYGSEDEFGAQLGKIRKKELIVEMLETPVSGGYELRSTSPIE